MKKLLMILLALTMVMGMVACGGEKAPDGYMSATCEGEIFSLYVPQSWKDNSKSGLSSASLDNEGVMVSAFTKTYEETDLPLAEYVELTIAGFESTLKEFNIVTEAKETVLASFPAVSFEYTVVSEEKAVKFRCIVAKTENAFTTLLFCAAEDVFGNFTEDFDGIAEVFTFHKEAGSAENLFVFKDEYTPDGFQLASGSQYEFRFFVPETWTVNTKADIPTAIFSATDLSNVTLNSFAVSGKITCGQEYWDSFVESYDYDIVDLEIKNKMRMGGYEAMSVEYVTHIGSSEYHIRQVFISTYTMVYILTYTSDAEHYSTHMRDVDKMIQEFEFKN